MASKAKTSEELREPASAEQRLRKSDVVTSVRLVEALDNENEPSWKEVKQMKDVLGESVVRTYESSVMFFFFSQTQNFSGKDNVLLGPSFHVVSVLKRIM